MFSRPSNLASCGSFLYPPPGQQHARLSMPCWNRLSTVIVKCIEKSPVRRRSRSFSVIVIVTTINLCVAPRRCQTESQTTPVTMRDPRVEPNSDHLHSPFQTRLEGTLRSLPDSFSRALIVSSL